MTQVQVKQVSIPAMSTIGYGYGKNLDTGRLVKFAGDHRPMRDLGDAIAAAQSEDDLPVVDLAGWQVIG